MSPHLYTVDQVAERLNLHAKTVRRYIREGRLKAKRIGKEYRVTRIDLDEFAGSSEPDPVVRTRQVTGSSILDVDAIGPDVQPPRHHDADGGAERAEGRARLSTRRHDLLRRPRPPSRDDRCECGSHVRPASDDRHARGGPP